jgi:hypothetical protein
MFPLEEKGMTQRFSCTKITFLFDMLTTAKSKVMNSPIFEDYTLFSSSLLCINNIFFPFDYSESNLKKIMRLYRQLKIRYHEA